MDSSHTPGRRDAYQAVTAALTGLTAFGCVTASGYVAGLVAHGHQVDRQRAVDEAEAAAAASAASLPAPAAPLQVVTKRRPHRTVVHTRILHRASTRTGVGAGGRLTSVAPSTSSYSTSSAGSVSRSRTVYAPAPRPAPAPAPAPSSGS